MTIYEAINTAIKQLEGVSLPVRDAGNADRVRTALMILDALKETVEKNTAKAEETTADETQTDTKEGDAQ